MSEPRCIDTPTDPQLAAAASFLQDANQRKTSITFSRQYFQSPDNTTLESQIRKSPTPISTRNHPERRQSANSDADYFKSNGPESYYSFHNYHFDPKQLMEFDYDNLVSYLDREVSIKTSTVVSDHWIKSHFFWSEAVGTIKAHTFDEFNFKPITSNTRKSLESGPFWMNFCNPDAEEMDNISKAFQLHPLTSEDIRTPDTREKCEVFANYYFVVIRTFDHDAFSENFMCPITMYIVIFKQCVISVLEKSNYSFILLILRIRVTSCQGSTRLYHIGLKSPPIG